ncbi:hypothetical protein [Mycolicibacterium pyrenivorans]|uniref:hypothetical protein n=1 Tax=Mycolicibacterium pyrenivorans TaxID=187102 RepID=UPI0021F3A0B2|nr:hypothetical protein [Mycolicibacterium pyrenivorans]MCV7154341.1 hypothetical protein [Mycolicibacterium pyrenivorans]
MNDDELDVDLGTEGGEEFDSALADALVSPVKRPDASVDKRIDDEKYRALRAANNYRRALVKWTLRVVGGLTAMATVFMGLYVCSQWDEIAASVMIAYFASVVAESIGVLYVIARYLFPSTGPGVSQ